MDPENIQPVESEMQTPSLEPAPESKKSKIKLIVLHIGALALLFSIFTLVLLYVTKNCSSENKLVPENISSIFEKIMNTTDSFEVAKFKSDEEFIQYLNSSDSLYSSSSYRNLTGAPMATVGLDEPIGIGDVSIGKSETPGRTSETNVQVEGIDEPDIVKAAEGNLFIGSRNAYRYDSLSKPYPGYEDLKTNIIDAFPPEEIKKIGDINKIGNLLYSKNTLIIFAYDKVFGYDVSDPSNPSESWNISYEEKTQYKDARLYEDNIYLITNTYINRSRPCPINPITHKGELRNIACTDVYYPKYNIPIDTTYTIFKIKAKTGEIEDSTSFVGTTGNSTIYMSPDNIFLTYSYSEDMHKILLDFITTSGTDLFDEAFIENMKRIDSYDISAESKLTEFTVLFENYQFSLSDDEKMRIENEMQNRMVSYMEDHVRDFSSTGIVKINRKNLNNDATGKVPGHPLNQFSLDEYEGNLRIATNSGDMLGFSSAKSVNDVYILNKNLSIIGSVKDMGKGERIYSARFLGDRGYVVTFRQIDPFYVLDLADPKNPQMKGELKIPGYSSYLHPLSKNIILGIGMESSQVKLSVFDVSNAEDPQEIDKYILDEYWSEISSTHHAFLMDPKHKVFFLPGNKGGYIFSYENNKLSLVKTESSTGVLRAVYMDDYLYIISTNKIVIINEKNWEEVKSFDY